MKDLEKILNKEQLSAVKQTEGPLLVLAGAGSGKTRVLTYRIAYLIENCGVAPWHILAITFTNKAAEEMRKRVDELLCAGGAAVWVSTFHSMCVRILRRRIEAIGYGPDFSIYDAEDQRTVMRQLFKELQIDPKSFRERAVLSAISAAKNAGISAEDFQKEQGSDLRGKRIADCYTAYEKRLRRNNALDFDDLLLKTVELFRKDPEILSFYQERFRYILVDEYQDTNDIQFELVHLLAERNRNICVVGDDDQSIYRFRGANLENILSFEKTWPDARVVKLEQNYRSTKPILDTANAVISHNKGRKEKRLWTEKKEGKEVSFTEYESASEEALAVLREVESCGRAYRDQAVLYRTNAQSRLFEEQCIRRNIPYQIVGGVNFYQRREIKDILAYMKLIANEEDDVAFERIINVPRRGIGAASLEKLRRCAEKEGLSLSEASVQAEEIGISGKALKALRSFREMLQGWRTALKEAGLLDEAASPGREGSYSLRLLIESIRDDSGYADELRAEGEVEAQTRLENIEEIISKAVSFQEEAEEVKLSAFLEEVSLISDLDRSDKEQDSLTLMTLHGAKGLEFPKVYLVGMSDGLFPGFLSINEPEELEEERRLCYVGITRAEEELVMSSARSRMINGEFQRLLPSRFIREMPDLLVKKELLYRPDPESRWEGDSEIRSGSVDLSATPFMGMAWRRRGEERGGSALQKALKKASGSFPSGPGIPPLMKRGSEIQKAEKLDYCVGDRVSHVKFGNGIVKAIEDGKRDYTVTVLFNKAGQKKMLAAFAKLKKIH